MRAFIRFLLLPYTELFYQMRARYHPILRFLIGTILFSILMLIWVNAGLVLGTYGVLFSTKYIDQFGLIGIPVHISGTGSMYPTFPIAEGTLQEQALQEVAAPPMYTFPGGFYAFQRWIIPQRQLHRGDIVSFSNEKTVEHVAEKGLSLNTGGFVKRVIALPGDLLEIRDGYVRVNNERISEPYIALPRSTFGGSFLPDCSTILVPDENVFVMGDNRKASGDSRHFLGLVRFQDISRILPLDIQQPYMSTWRDASHDNDTASTPLLHAQDYIQKLNVIRKDNGVKPLRYQPKLEQSARFRAQVMLRTNDLSFEATRSGYTMERAMRDAGYSNIIWGEAPTLGYYTADELLQNYAEFPEWKKFLLDDRYQETGIATVVGQIHGCPVQIVVQHVAGYQPPNYNPSDVSSWKDAAEKLRSILPSWENARTFGQQYEERKDDYEKMIQLLRERLSISETVYTRMSANQWLTDGEQELIKKDKDLATQQEILAKSLNQ